MLTIQSTLLQGNYMIIILWAGQKFFENNDIDRSKFEIEITERVLAKREEADRYPSMVTKFGL